MKSMLILTDFSEEAFRAAEYACELAGSLYIERIVLYHAYQTVIPGTDLPATVIDDQQLYLESKEQKNILLKWKKRSPTYMNCLISIILIFIISTEMIL